MSNVKISIGCASTGVSLLVLATFTTWQPLLFFGLALLAVSHILTPCQDQITRWWRSRIAGR